jgi:CRP/FNR family cyclic AMP-dependent transcriptional regulator
MLMREMVDLRRVTVWERAAIVLEESSKLAADGCFEFLTEVDPRALIARLEQLRPAEFAFEHRQIGDAEWRVKLTRLRADKCASSLEAALHRSPVFARLSGNGRARIVEAASEHSARKCEIVCAENADCSALGLVLEGAFAVFVGAGSRERLLFHLMPFETFGDCEFFDEGLSIGRTVALSKSGRYALIPFEIVRSVGMQEPEFLLAIGASAAQHNRAVASALAAQVSQPIIARVAAALLAHAAPERELHPALPPLPHMTQAQIAAAAGTVKEVAARAIAELERVQALRRERGHILFLDRAKLLSVIEEAP